MLSHCTSTLSSLVVSLQLNFSDKAIRLAVFSLHDVRIGSAVIFVIFLLGTKGKSNKQKGSTTSVLSIFTEETLKRQFGRTAKIRLWLLCVVNEM